MTNFTDITLTIPDITVSMSILNISIKSNNEHDNKYPHTQPIYQQLPNSNLFKNIGLDTAVLNIALECVK